MPDDPSRDPCEPASRIRRPALSAGAVVLRLPATSRRAPRMAKTMVKIPNAAARPINVIRTIRITCCGSPSVDGLVKWGTRSIIGSLLFQDTEALRLDAEGYVELAAVDGRPSDRVSLRVSEKGAVSVWGLGRFPVTLYKEQWMKLLDVADEIRAFISEHDAELKAKDPK